MLVKMIFSKSTSTSGIAQGLKNEQWNYRAKPVAVTLSLHDYCSWLPPPTKGSTGAQLVFDVFTWDTQPHTSLSLFPLTLYIKYPSKAKWDDKGESKAMHASTLFPFPRLNLSFSSFSQLLCMLNLEGYTNRNPFLIDFEQYTFWELQSNIITFPRWFLMENAHLPFLWYFC